MIIINGEKYQCKIPARKVLDIIDMGYFDPRRCFEVVYLDKATGKLSVMIWGHQSTPESAMLEAMAYCNQEEVEVIDAYPVIELIEDRECLERRLNYQLSRRNEINDKKERLPHYFRALREKPRETIQKLRALKGA